MVVVLDLESKSGDDPTDFSARAGVSIVDLGLLKKGVVKFRLKRKSLFFAHVREGANGISARDPAHVKNPVIKVVFDARAPHQQRRGVDHDAHTSIYYRL